jgi:hypothetical protein
MLNLVILWINDRSTVMHLSNHRYPPWKHDNRSLTHTLTSWCLPKCGIFITFKTVDLAMSIVHGLWHGSNGPTMKFWAINSFLTVREHRLNGHIASNDHIVSSWLSVNLCCTDIPTKFEFWKSFFCKVFSETCNFSNFSLFLLIFLAFFPMI